MWDRNSVALLPATKYWGKINPAKPEDHSLYEGGLTVLEVWRNEKGSLSVALGSGDSFYHKIGDTIKAHHDQTGRNFGYLTLVGTSAGGEVRGELPDRKMNVRVYK